jgi:hypothetical protein
VHFATLTGFQVFAAAGRRRGLPSTTSGSVQILVIVANRLAFRISSKDWHLHHKTHWHSNLRQSISIAPALALDVLNALVARI